MTKALIAALWIVNLRWQAASAQLHPCQGLSVPFDAGCRQERSQQQEAATLQRMPNRQGHMSVAD
jgi:hypothetical protein